MPFMPLLFCFLTVPLAVSIKDGIWPGLTEEQNVFIDTVLLSIGAISGVVIILMIARSYFARRLKGFGVNIKTAGTDLLFGFVNLLAVNPFVLLALLATIFFGKLIWGPDFQIYPHRELELLTGHPQLAVRILIVAVSCLIMPVFEEMLFRGLFQTMIRSFIEKPWVAILATSALFVTVHANPAHWPALFVLAMCLGYSYEKSGSILRPIFIHILFNTTSVVGTLLVNSG